MIYGRLNPEEDDIRLLLFSVPLALTSPTICCSLKVFSLEDESLPNYIALSYVWGPSAWVRHTFVRGLSWWYAAFRDRQSYVSTRVP